MDRERFEELVGEALDGLPDEFLEHLENVHVDVEDWPSAMDLEEAGLPSNARYSLLGLYHGVPNTVRGAYYMALPDRISIYRGPIEAVAGPSDEAIKDQVRRTVVHEIAHFYGLSDDRLNELGWG
ncbi:MAG: metallopeptidase family protein [Actinobacteria bacterium]|nr:metallopeptidase family protein [Actinomycetota bacterium]